VVYPGHVGVQDRFGQSAHTYAELQEEHGLIAATSPAPLEIY
jgi:hypothetical protein